MRESEWRLFYPARMAIAVCLSCTLGCTYLENRGKDFLDIWTLDAGLGNGIGVDFQITDAVHSGLGGGITNTFSLPNRRRIRSAGGMVAVESTAALLLHRKSGPTRMPIRQGFLWNFLHWPKYFAEVPTTVDWNGNTIHLPAGMNRNAPAVNLLDADVGILMVPLTARVGVSPGEALDFLLGWMGIDIAADDTGRNLMEVPHGEYRTISSKPVNPSFPISIDEAWRILRGMEENPKPLRRPVVICGGYLDPGSGWMWMQELRKLTREARILDVSFFLCTTFDQCRTSVIEKVDRAFPTTDALWTTEVDVVAISMGGLVARHAAAPPLSDASSSRRLKIARLFTISSPHRGARMAAIPTVHPLHWAMRPGSTLLRHLRQSYGEAGYELFPYARLADFFVGPQNAAPLGEVPWWIPNPPFDSAHLGAITDPRILADIARRLRGEAPFTTLPRAPLPDSEKRD